MHALIGHARAVPCEARVATRALRGTASAWRGPARCTGGAAPSVVGHPRVHTRAVHLCGYLP
eukprot:12038690-Alexandrium_andersonii.AAC.1